MLNIIESILIEMEISYKSMNKNKTIVCYFIDYSDIIPNSILVAVTRLSVDYN